MILFFNVKQVTFAQLKQQLKQLAGIGHIALRRDKNIPCEWEDKIILLCQQSKINQISIVVR
jgi:biopolymer transport protein ExbD